MCHRHYECNTGSETWSIRAQNCPAEVRTDFSGTWSRGAVQRSVYQSILSTIDPVRTALCSPRTPDLLVSHIHASETLSPTRSAGAVVFLVTLQGILSTELGLAPLARNTPDAHVARRDVAGECRRRLVRASARVAVLQPPSTDNRA